MGLPVTIKVNFRGNVKRFLTGDLDKLEWSSVEAWIKASFGINHFQAKYFDEDSEEICINSQEEYEEAIKSAEKQGNHLNMNVYKLKGQACGGPLKTEVKELKGDLRPAPPYPSRVKTVDKGTQVTPERESVVAKDNKGAKAEDEPPPMWFRSYMEKFKDEVVKEVVERMCSDFSGQCCTHKSPAAPPPEASGNSCAPVMGPRPGPPANTIGPKPGPSTSSGSLGYTPNCSSCNKLTSEGAYKCSVCPSCILCEMCRHSHDPSHNLVRTKTPLSIPEHGMSGELRGPGASHSSLLPTLAALFLDENLPDGTRLEPGTKFIKYWKMKNSGTIGWTPETKLVFMWGNLGLASEERRSVPVPLLLPGQVGVVSVTFVAPVMEGTYTSHWRLAHRGHQFGPRVWCSIVVEPGNGINALKHHRKRLREQLKPGSKDEILSKECLEVDIRHNGFFLPYVDLLTAQDLLSFELMDINIVQELEKVPNNTPVDLTPCISPLPHDAAVPEKALTAQIKDDSQVTGVRKLFGGKTKHPREHPWEAAVLGEEHEEEISGAQFLCETVIRSLTLEEAPDHRPVRRNQEHSARQAQVVSRGPKMGPEGEPPSEKGEREDNEICGPTTMPEIIGGVLPVGQHQDDEDDEDEDMKECKEEKADDWDEVSSQTSSSSSCDDFIIVLPDCFDMSRPLGESMYSSAMSQPDAVVTATLASPEPLQEEDYASDAGGVSPPPPGEREHDDEKQTEDDDDPAGDVVTSDALTIHSSVNQMLCASQTLDAATLTPEVVPPPPAIYSPRSEALYLAEDACHAAEETHTPRVHANVSSGLSRSAGSASSAFETYNPRPSNALQPRVQGGLTEGLVKGALSVAASAYKALFTGPNCPIQRGVDPAARQDPSLMAMLLEMGFRDRHLNQRLLRKHSYNLLHTVNELVQMAEDAPPGRAVQAPH
ncbi:NBR1 autophagy cargo receptor a isoform X5 [Corythoichthys intestinalis]|uniref:NBR1 autophagy cargo receptor a isoform X5 n=1 Tax=Corythoichthys intestinalis TaxID=161448 RepID=UPI0025A5E063|nr:NBR1 autophagy cargo receptor a isoform X5 [Corythoichthys intestinalis]